MKFINLIFLIVHTQLFAEKIVILTHVYNRPDFIKIQHDLYKKFLKDDFELIIFDNSDIDSITEQFKKTCNDLNIKYIRIPQNIHNSNGVSERVACAINYSLLSQFDNNEILAIIASDIFLIKELCISDFMKHHDIAGFYQNRKHVNYLWDHIVFLKTNLPNLSKINFNCGYVDQLLTDVGGHLYYYLHQYPLVKIKYVDQIYIDSSDKNKARLIKRSGSQVEENEYDLKGLNLFNEKELELISEVDNIEFYINRSFIHYRNGTNWNNNSKEFHKKKTKALNHFLNLIN